MGSYLKSPTLFPYDNFNSQDDARQLTVALQMKDSSRDAATIIHILCRRSSSQRQEIINSYKEQTMRDLYQDAKSSLSGKFSKVIRSLLRAPFEYLASDIKKAMAGLGTDEDCLTEVLCSRSNDKIQLITLAFHNRYGRTIQEELEDEYKISSEYKELLGMLLSGIRDEKRPPDPEKARKRAETLFVAERNAWSTERKIFMRLLTHEPVEQLRVIFDEYRRMSGQSMQEAIQTEFSGDLRNAMLTIVKSAINRAQYYAEKLESAMKGLRFDDDTIIRIIVSRCEIDLDEIKGEYLKIYHKTLYHSIQTRISGDYRTAMLALIGTP
ncbi:annexin B10 [Folsomia candida]|nr:annexin B10 [Folsomia candida]